jgi:hypothetical protein
MEVFWYLIDTVSGRYVCHLKASLESTGVGTDRSASLEITCNSYHKQYEYADICWSYIRVER